MKTVEWLVKKYFEDYNVLISELEFQQAKEMEKQQQDEFAIKFNDWVNVNAYKFPTKITTKELLEIYKKRKRIMTPKEKALELMDKYWELNVDDKAPVFTEKCKQCALIAVDEIYNLCWNGNLKAKEYWFEVKQEIEKL